ncbi:MAG: response regulator transcription factor [Verrucomicrobia bacterium]|jgi:DNA-binding response OmpR family regulator|nr:response regulator transcription factor [Verrucomicrobiota bacterium]
MRILVADDDAKAAGLLVQGLKAEGYAVDLASDGDEATWLAETNPYDALVLDVMMPAKDGFSVVRHLRKKGILTPVIFVTARGEVEDRVRGLDAGGDDYLAKPFSLAELLARLRATLRRQRPQASNTLRLADLEMDLLSRKVRRGGQDIVLTNREFALLEFLLVNSPKPVSKMAIVEHVWDQHFDSQTNVVNVYVNYLRNKIDVPGSKPLLHTVRGVGFALTDEQ